MAQLQYIAQATQDLYYQQFKADEDFFDIDHFKYLNTVCYADWLQQYYDDNYKKNLAEKGMGDVELSDDLFIIEQSEVKHINGEYFVELKQKPYSFLHDNQHRSVNNIFPEVNNKCRVKLIRIPTVEVWKLQSLPATSYTFWYVLGKKIKFEKVNCGIGNITIQYLPSLADMNDTDELADSLQRKVIEGTLNLMIAARNGTIINLTNNQNTNKTMETELDNLFRMIKTKMG